MKKTLAVFLSASLLFAASGCSPSAPAWQEPPKEEEAFHYTYCDYINDATTVVSVCAPDECLYYRDLLKKDGLDGVYDAIVYAASHLADPVQGQENVSEVCFDRDVTDEDLERAYMYAVFDHPELWHLNPPRYVPYTRDEKNPRVIYLVYGVNRSEVPALDQKIRAASEETLLMLDGLKEQEDVVSRLCAYFAENYDFENSHFEGKTHISIKDFFLDKMGNCFVSAQALNYLLRKAGFVALLAAGGTKPQTITHFWTVTVSYHKYVYTDLYSIAGDYSRENRRFNWNKIESADYEGHWGDLILFPQAPLAGSKVEATNP